MPVLVVSGEPIDAGVCYAKFDEQGKTYADCTSVASYFLQKKEIDSFYLAAKNDLLPAAKEISPDIETVMGILKDYGRGDGRNERLGQRCFWSIQELLCL